MKTQLIMLDTPIIVSDETATSQDYGFNGKEVVLVDLWKNRNLPKVIASTDWDSFNLPSIDWNGLEEEFGIIDIEKLYPTNRMDKMSMPTRHQINNALRQEGFKKALALNEKKFSLEDMIMAYRKGESSRFSRIGEAVLEKEFIQSLQQPKVFDIIVEMEAVNDYGEPYSFDDMDFGVEKEYTPKITNNQIKILSIK